MKRVQVEYLNGTRRIKQEVTVRGLDGVDRLEYKMCCMCKELLPIRMFRYELSRGNKMRSECVDCYDHRAKGYEYGEVLNLETEKLHVTKIDTRKYRMPTPKTPKGEFTNTLIDFMENVNEC